MLFVMLLPGRRGRARICRPPLSVRDPFSPSFGHGREKGSEAVSPVTVVWPCPLPAGAYAAAGRGVVVPSPDCPSCAGPMTFWSGYRRYLRGGRPVPEHLRAEGPLRACGVTHALLPAFALAWRLDAAETIGAVIARVAAGQFAGSGRRPP